MICCAYIKILDSPMLVDQNMVCESSKDQRDYFPRIHLDISLFSGIHQICIPTFPFDPSMQSDTLLLMFSFHFT